MNLQSRYDLEVEKDKLENRVKTACLQVVVIENIYKKDCLRRQDKSDNYRTFEPFMNISITTINQCPQTRLVLLE